MKKQTQVASVHSGFDEHPQRVALINELHARPFQPATAPGRVMHFAFKQPKNAAERDLSLDRDHLLALLDFFGAAHPAPGAKQHSVELGRFRLKWESHTEFVTYTLIEEGPTEALFSGELAKHISMDWMAAAPGHLVAAVQCELIDDRNNAVDAPLPETLMRHFDPQSVAASQILDGNAITLGDFRVHEQGYTRFAVVQRGSLGSRRLGRAVQRLVEIEVYRAMAMLALPIARDVARRLNEVERQLAELTSDVSRETRDLADADALQELMRLSAEIESMAAASAFRFDAAQAYQSIVSERLDALRERTTDGRQHFAEFMERRFAPAMRTAHAAKNRLAALSVRAARTAELLRTRVNVSLEEQNKSLLESMDKRAALHLRLQETVEGLSVVAISYYAVSLSSYLLAPIAKSFGLDKSAMLALVAVPIIGGVWWFTRQIRKRASRA